MIEIELDSGMEHIRRNLETLNLLIKLPQGSSVLTHQKVDWDKISELINKCTEDLSTLENKMMKTF